MLTRKHLIIGIVTLLLALIGFISNTPNSISSESSIVNFTLKKLWFIIIPLSIYFSYSCTFNYKKNLEKWRNGLAIIMLTFVFFMIISFSFKGLVSLYNSNIGRQNSVSLNAKIISINRKQHDAGNFTYKLKIMANDDSIDLKINKTYYDKYINQSHFIENLELGSLGFYYKTE